MPPLLHRWPGPSTPCSACSSDGALLRRVVASAQVALELPSDRLPGRLRSLGEILRLLQAADVLRHLAVLRRQLVDAPLPCPRVLGKVPERDGYVEQVLDVAEQGEGGLGAGGLGDVVRNRRPDRQRRDARLAAGVVEDADDAGRALVARLLQV